MWFAKPKHVAKVGGIYVHGDERGISISVVDGTRTLTTDIHSFDVATFLMAVAEAALPAVRERLKETEKEIEKWKEVRDSFTKQLESAESNYLRKHCEERIAEAETYIAQYKVEAEKLRTLKGCLESILFLAE